jgi:hypothetical protein
VAVTAIAELVDLVRQTPVVVVVVQEETVALVLVDQV